MRRGMAVMPRKLCSICPRAWATFSGRKSGRHDSAEWLLYGIDTVVDVAPLALMGVYFDAATTHEQLIHMGMSNLKRLLGKATHARFSVRQ